MNFRIPTWIRAVVALVVLLILILTVRGWLTEYREAPGNAEPAETTQTAPATPDTEAQPEGENENESDASGDESKEIRVVTTTGLNLRVEPDTTSKALRGLSEGEKLIILEKTGDWYHVTTEKSETGYVNGSKNYTKAE